MMTPNNNHYAHFTDITLNELNFKNSCFKSQYPQRQLERWPVLTEMVKCKLKLIQFAKCVSGCV